MCAGFFLVVFYFILPSGSLCVSFYKEWDTQKLGQKHQEKLWNIAHCSRYWFLSEVSYCWSYYGGKSGGTDVCPFLITLMEHPAVEPTHSGICSIWITRKNRQNSTKLWLQQYPTANAQESGITEWTQSNTVEEYFSRSQ